MLLTKLYRINYLMRAAYLKCHSYLNIVCIAVLFLGADMLAGSFYDTSSKQALSYLQAYFSLHKSNILFYPSDCGSHTTKIVCGTNTTIKADDGNSNYTWSTGETTQSITVTTSGTYWWETLDMTNNKVVNGYFTSGNSGFTSEYNYISPTGSTGGSGALSAEKYYTITTDPHIAHSSFASFPDHTANTTGTRNMMVINGAPQAGVAIWKETITVQPNTDYVFSIWMTSVYSQSPGILNFSINNTSLGSPILLTSGTPDWKNFTVRWSSGSNTSADIAIVNQNTAASGNDFAIDDIVFAPVCRKYFDVTISPYPATPTITPR